MKKILKILGPFFLAISVSALSIFAPPKPVLNDATEKVQQKGETRGHQIEQEKGVTDSEREPGGV